MRILVLTLLIMLISCNSQETKLDRIQVINPFVTQLGQFTTFGGDNSGSDGCHSMVVDKYENIYCAGVTDGSMTGPYATVADDAVIVKLNRHGVLQWVLQLNTDTVSAFNGGEAGGVDHCNSLALDRDQNVYCGGNTFSNLGGPGSQQGTVTSDAFIAKITPAGKLAMIRQYGASAVDKNDTCEGLTVDALGKIYCAGSTSGNLGEVNAQGAGTGDIYIGKFNNDGSTNWIRQLGSVSKVSTNPSANLGSDVCHTILLSTDEKTVYCAGYAGTVVASPSFGARDFVIIAMNTSDGLNLKGFQDGSGSLDECMSLAKDKAGNIYCGGTTRGVYVFNAGGTTDFVILKIDSSLNFLSRFQYSSTAFANDDLYSIKLDRNENIIMAGRTAGDLAGNLDTNDNGVLLKVDPLGNEIWGRSVGAFGNSDGIRSLFIDKDQNIYGTGSTLGDFGETHGGGSADIHLFRLDPNGND